MRQGDGSDLLGSGNPQNSDIGIIYVEPTDTRPDILKAINTQEITGRKQIAIVLLEQHGAFRQSAEFDGLKNVRWGLKAQLVFIASPGADPANFAHQRNFPVYSSLENLRQVLLTEGIQPASRRAKSQRRRLDSSSPKAKSSSPVTTQEPSLASSPVTTQELSQASSSVTTQEPSLAPAPATTQEPSLVSSPVTTQEPSQASSPVTQANEQITIYINPEEKPTNVRERLERTQNRRIALFVPEQSQWRSHVRWRLIYARMRELDKELLVISPDGQVREVARAAGFQVAAPPEASSDQSEPERQTSPHQAETEDAQLPAPLLEQKESAPDPVEEINRDALDILDQPTEIMPREMNIPSIAPLQPLQPQQAKEEKPILSGSSQPTLKAGKLSGQQFGHYRLTYRLGKGGFAEVYLGEHIHLGTTAAIKVLDQEHMHAEDQQAFAEEARTVAKLIHPHIVRLLDFGFEEATPFLVMDYAPSGTLRTIHRSGIMLPLPTVIAYARQVASALQFAHNHHVIHQDIKPENMLVGRNQEILVGDFGIALTVQGSRALNTQEAIGTASYMAPEQLQGKPHLSTDQYALAIVIYEWLTGSPPFRGSSIAISTQHIYSPVPSLRAKRSDLPLGVELALAKALAKKPEERFASVNEFVETLAEATKAQELSSVSPLESRPKTPQAASPLTATQPASTPVPVEALVEFYNAVRQNLITDPARILDFAQRFEELARDPVRRQTLSFDAERAARALRTRAQKLQDLAGARKPTKENI